MHASSTVLSQQPWPQVSFGSLRLWDTATNWNQINIANGVYDFSLLDQWLSTANQHGVQDLLYTFGKTPQWASSRPNDQRCANDWGPGACDPPDDLNPDGSGSDQHWKDFVSALATHVGTSIKYWEIWNEPSSSNHWTGTVAQMVRMAQDARTAILTANPAAVLLTPPGQGAWMSNYLAAGGGTVADVVTFHGYPQATCSAPPVAASILQAVSATQALMTAAGINKPIWDTEASWGYEQKDCFNDLDQQAAFLAQFYLLHLSAGVQRFYWYQWNNPAIGTLWVPGPGPQGTVLKPGVAYQQLFSWVVGHSLVSACTVSGTQWQCQLNGSGGYQSEAIWDTSQTCNNGSCTTENVTVPSTYLHYHDLSGNTFSVINNVVPVGLKPILLVNR